MLKYNFPENLKKLRKINNLSQLDLSKKLGVTRQSISYYENGICEPSLHFILQLSSLFDCSVDSLIFKEYSSDFLEKNNFINQKKIDSLINLDLDIVNSDKLINILEINKGELYEKINDINDLINHIKNFSKINNTEYANELCFDTDTKVIDFDFYKNTKIIESPSYFNLKNKDDFFKLPCVGHVSAGYPQYACEDIEDFFYIPKEYIKSNEDDYFILRIKGESMNKLYKNGDYVLIRKTCCVEGQDPSVVLVNNEEATVKYVKFDNEYFYLQPYSDHPNFQENTSYKTDENTISVIGTVIGVVFREG